MTIQISDVIIFICFLIIQTNKPQMHPDQGLNENFSTKQIVTTITNFFIYN